MDIDITTPSLDSVEERGIIIVSTGMAEVDDRLAKAMEVLEPEYGKCLVIGDRTPNMHALIVGAVGTPTPDISAIINSINQQTVILEGHPVDDRKSNQPYYRKFDKHNKW